MIQRASVVGKVFWWGAVTELSPEDDRPQRRLPPADARCARSSSALTAPGSPERTPSGSATSSSATPPTSRCPSVPAPSCTSGSPPGSSARPATAVAEFEEILGYHLEHAYRYRAALGPGRRGDPGGRRSGGGTARRGRPPSLLQLGRRRRGEPALPRGRPPSSGRCDAARRPARPRDRARPVRHPTRGVGAVRGDRGRAWRHRIASVEARAGVRREFVRLLLDPDVNQADSIREVERYMALFEERGDDQGLGEAGGLLGMIRLWQGRAGLGEEVFERAIGHARRAGDRRQEGEILRRLALVIETGPTTVEEGIRRLQSVIEQSRGDRRVEIGASRARAELEAMQGRFDAGSRAHLEEQGAGPRPRGPGRAGGRAPRLRYRRAARGRPGGVGDRGAPRVRDPRADQRSRPSRELGAGPGRRGLRPGALRGGGLAGGVRTTDHDRGRR